MVNYKFKVGDKVRITSPPNWDKYMYIIIERKVDQWRGLQYKVEIMTMPQGELVFNHGYCAEDDLIFAYNGIEKAIKRIYGQKEV